MPKKSSLAKAQRAKKDEFYTRWEEIEKEIQAYIEYNPDVFRNKTILLPADDPFESNFFKYFATHFNDYGLKKLISTSYDPSPIVNTQLELSLFDDNSAEITDGNTTKISKAYKIELKDVSDFDNNGRINIEDVEAKLTYERKRIAEGKHSSMLSYLKEDSEHSAGDFRSEEVTRLRDESDFIITNPPFSLFREFVEWIQPDKRNFIILGNVNAITYKQIFPWIEHNKMWLGYSIHSGDRIFYVPNDYELNASGSGIDQQGRKYIRVKGVRWFTNVDHGRRHRPLSLMTMKDNIKFSKHKQVRGHEYIKYDNYDAIEVPFTDAIPSDYDGLMGVPITFLDKYNPDQFEIKGITQSWYGKASKIYPKQIQVSRNNKEKEVTKLNDGPAIKINKPLNKTYYKIGNNLYEKLYSRILIKKK